MPENARHQTHMSSKIIIAHLLFLAAFVANFGGFIAIFIDVPVALRMIGSQVPLIFAGGILYSLDELRDVLNEDHYDPDWD